ncbi:unnamed protein product [Eruca vesicaria subsp. sativa]|uniref:NYN domain-containing protein n=1 Tax=Eruca vesicaria subsp. sativa TaxID=29727 RepID=A0ABC8K3W8_ERUVS|nr:unnamed protein product [Eruca vesicaria subsp. sativa]
MKFFEANTVVFWDVTDFPIHTGRSYLETLTSVLGNNGYNGKLKITAYGEEKPDNLGDKYSRLCKMLLDIAVWGMDTSHLSFTPKNVMVLAENIEEDTCFVHVSKNLLTSANNCLWVLPDDYEDEKIKRVKLPWAKLYWKWQDLLAGKDPMSCEDVRALRLKAPSNSLVE